MAVRHDVENLIRRGNIFYWRARIPKSFTACRSGSRLSLSLQCSDHKKAQVIARRLNMRLAELKLNSKGTMSTKEQLQKLFEHIRDDMLEQLDDVGTAAKRYGRPDDVVEMELDLEMGWAYRLLAMFGIRRELRLEGDCNGRTYLLKNGVPASHISAIKANYVGELQISRRPAFENNIRKLMAEFDIPDTALNREKAMSKVFDGRAEALLDIDDRHPLADRSLSEFTGGFRPVSSATASIAAREKPPAVMEPPATVDTASAPVEVSTPTPPPLYLNLTPKPASPAEDAHVDAEEPDDADAEEKVVAVADFETECTKLITNMGDEWEPATARDAMALVRMFKGVLEEHGVEHSAQITQYHIGQLRQHFNEIPVRWGQSHKMRAMSAAELRAEGRKLREAAEAVGKKAEVGLSAATIRKHFGNLQHFLKHVRGHGYEITDWTFEGLRPRKPKKGAVRKQQYKPTPADISPIFASPVYTGSLNDARGRGKPGLQVFHDGVYFLPIMFTYLGARRAEFAALQVGDIYKFDGHWVIDLKPNELRRVKTEQSTRMLPLPDELVRLGLLRYQNAIRKLGYKQLFPDLFSDQTANDPGDRFYDVFTPIMKNALKEKMWNRAYHALRHGMADTLKQAGISTEVVDDISGRLSEGSETNTRYTNPAGLPLMRMALEKYPIITADIQPRPIQLLPWVENRQPPPWARKGKK